MAACAERRDVEFKTIDGVTLRGWFYPAGNKSGKAPAIVISHGWSCVKEMYLDVIASKFQAIGLASLVYDHRNIGASDGTPRAEIKPQQQCEDIHEAISFLIKLPEVDASKIALWGYSLSGSHAVKAAAIDRRVKAIVTVCPMLNTIRGANRMIPRSTRAALDKALMEDREARARGEDPAYGVIASADPSLQPFLLHADAEEFFFRMKRTVAPGWENKHTLQSIFGLQLYNPAGYVEAVSPTPWLMIQGNDDNVCIPDLELGTFEQARQPKEFFMYEGGHFAPFGEGIFEEMMATEIEFLKRRLKF